MIYEVLGLPGVKFQIYAGEKICTPDNQENVLLRKASWLAKWKQEKTVLLFWIIFLWGVCN